MMLTPSLALGWYPLPMAFALSVFAIGALLLGLWIGDKIVQQWRR
jgi:hypothetical protein